MSLIPAFEIGLWNAWIIIVLSLITGPVLGSVINKEAMKKFMTEPTVSHESRETISNKIYPYIALASTIYSIFLPLKLGTVWFYVGLPICVLVLAMNLVTIVSFTTTPIDEPVTQGTYRISRHPVIFGSFLLHVGIGIACASWIYLLYATVFMILMRFSVEAEERFCLDKYGEVYRDYLNRTPRWIGISKSS
jgi:protein-S-isoprenylcysteine O-methyltransferase Ste14